MKLLPLSLLAATVAGCATDPASPPSADPDEAAPDAPLFTLTDPTDADGDGVPEQLEDFLMTRFGPELRLAPDAIDWTRPANVDWYLSKVRMRFDHPQCPDDGSHLLDVGAITFDNIHAQRHHTRSSSLTLCRHDTDAASERSSDQKHLEFFLQAADDALVHPGIPPARSSEWRTYTQVRPSGYVRADGVAAAYDLQIWYFFPYNDFVAFGNHESDWEHMTLSISKDFDLVSVFFATHDAGDRFDDLAALELVDQTHVVGYVADGSHATYARVGEHAGPAPGLTDHTYADGPRWQSWKNFVNLGAIGKILGGQRWAAYGGRWGEVGATSFTSGPPGPMFNSKWDTRNEYPK